jgi:hypothetical protein
MGPKALKRWNDNVQSIAFYADTKSITRFTRTLHTTLGGVEGIRGLCLRNSSRPYLCDLHLNGGGDTGDAASWKTTNLYAHEFAHAIDWGNADLAPLSSSQAWKDAWHDEGDEINGRLGIAGNEASEGFGNFAVFAWNYPEDARRHYPECWRFWEERGLAVASSAR